MILCLPAGCLLQDFASFSWQLSLCDGSRTGMANPPSPLPPSARVGPGRTPGTGSGAGGEHAGAGKLPPDPQPWAKERRSCPGREEQLALLSGVVQGPRACRIPADLGVGETGGCWDIGAEAGAEQRVERLSSSNRLFSFQEAFLRAQLVYAPFYRQCSRLARAVGDAKETKSTTGEFQGGWNLGLMRLSCNVPPGHGAVQPALGDPAWAGGWAG